MVKIGLEIHQQLDTKKLFCNCPSLLVDNPEEDAIVIFRKFKTTRSELSEKDIAAMVEEKRIEGIIYYGPKKASCAVEWDEEPPHTPNPQAVREAIKIAKLLNAKVVDEIHFMRKIILDGSVVSGFQRTALIATDGSVEGIKIETICLEEDSAKPLGRKGKLRIFSLDRLGIPLVEITTAPEIEDPNQAVRVAKRIGELLRMARVRRGIGTIRQDINVSVEGGARVEIKGVQELEMIPRIIELEIERQKNLLKLQERFKKLGISEIKDVSKAFKNTSFKIFKKRQVFGMCIKNGRGLFSYRLNERKTLGNEVAGFVKAHGFGGFVHTDEGLARYGITEQELEEVRAILNAGPNDLIILSTEKGALNKVIERLEAFSRGVPEETRKANPDGSTTYMRPLPGKARMYPETDVPPLIPPDVKKPETPEERFERLKKRIGERYAKELLFYPEYEEFKALGEDLIAAKAMVEVRPAVIRMGLKFDVEKVKGVLEDIRRGKIAEDALFSAIVEVLKGKKVETEKMSREELKKLIEDVVKERKEYVLEAENPEKGIMGIVMAKIRGKAPGKIVYEIVRKVIEEYRKRQSS